MNISEIYQSVQGEGELQGTTSTFVRVAGCNLRCWFCDTPFASWKPEGEDHSLEEIMQRVSNDSAQHVVLTGGEPMLFAEMIPLTQQLHRLGKHITVETAGTLFLPVACDLMSISPKLQNSDPSEELAGKWSARHQRDRHRPEVIHQLLSQYHCQLKFVIDRPEDIQDVEDYLSEFPFVRQSQVWLMPQGTDAQQLLQKETWLLPACQERDWHLCRRKHIEWFGHRRGV